jgi:hypothetical protein
MFMMAMSTAVLLFQPETEWWNPTCVLRGNAGSHAMQ